MSNAMSGNPVSGEPATRSAIPRSTAILLGVAAAVVAAFGMWAAAGILTPVVLALVLTICVQPVRTGLEKRGVPRGLATGSVILVVFGLLLGFIGLLIVAVANFAQLLPTFGPQLAAIGDSIVTFLESIGFGAAQAEEVAAGLDPTKIVDFFSSLIGGVTGLISWLVIILTMLILMASDGGYIPSLLKQIRPKRPDLVSALTNFGHGVRRYMVVTTLLGVGQGVFNWLALTALQVPGALLWGLLSFLCSFIPNVGYFIAIIPPLVFGFLTGGWPVFVAIILIYGVINAVVQSVVQPRVVGNAVQLSQTLTFFSVLLWSLIFGAIGAILAVPLTLLVRTVLIDSDPSTRMWRPLTGDVGETRDEMKAEDVERKAERKANKGKPKPQKTTTKTAPKHEAAHGVGHEPPPFTPPPAPPSAPQPYSPDA